ncbi:MAG TPA: MFS transporter [Burkholderiales bacterium]|nr:MFS transporter [Burkholderiales bacterium]
MGDGRRESGQFALLVERRFGPFFLVQFFGAFNSNVVKNALVIFVTYQSAHFAAGSPLLGDMESGVIVNLAAGLFVLPFILFSATAGQIADKYEKSYLIRAVKVFEIAVMALAAWGFLGGHLGLLLAALFLIGTQSSLFGPVKYSLLPQVLRETELVGGNALVESGTFVAILLGTIAGGVLASLSGNGPAAAAFAVIALAIIGFATSCFIPRLPAVDPALRIDWNPVRETWRNFRYIRGHRTVFLSILGISWFWLYGALFLSQFPDYAKTVLEGGETSVSALLAIFSVGIGVGSLLCERLSGHKVEIGLVPFGSIGLTLFGVDLYFASQSLPGGALVSTWTLFSGPYLRVVADLFLMGAFGGFYIVPLYALIQSRTDQSHVSRVVAGNNILNAFFMVAGSGVAIALIKLGFSVTEILLAAALMNAVVAAYIYTLVPEFLMRFMVWMLIHTVYRLEKSGLERIPDDGPAILVCNHVSFVDALVIAAACRRPIRWVMDHRIFAVPLLSFFFRTVRAIPIAPAREDPKLLERAYAEIAAALAGGELVGLFPEGRLTSDGEMGVFRSGIRQALDRTPVPVVPMALSGLWQSLFARNPGKFKRMRGLFPKIRLAVGEPVAAAAATPEHLHDLVLGLRGEWR